VIKLSNKNVNCAVDFDFEGLPRFLVGWILFWDVSLTTRSWIGSGW
jgi:hypothetical protein